MNMAKVGIVSRSLTTRAFYWNSIVARVSDVTRYTLCVFQGDRTRHGSQYGFATEPVFYRSMMLSIARIAIDKIKSLTVHRHSDKVCRKT